jgi:hypothetical protein
MTDAARFAFFMLAAAFIFNGVVIFVLRTRTQRPEVKMLASLTILVVVLGMLFARYAHILFQPPWWVYYGVPASTTLLLPPAALRMRRNEVLQYIPLAILMAPAIHLFFSLFIGWHDYMPFPFYIPSLLEFARKISVLGVFFSY